MPFNALSESLSFHKSPESFVSSRLADIARKNPSSMPSSTASINPVRASILNRNVHIITDYDMCLEVLGSVHDQNHEDERPRQCPFHAASAYNELMASFFPPPNLLLGDGNGHGEWKVRWARQLENVPEDIQAFIKPVIAHFVEATLRHESTIDLYEAMKTLAWRLLFTIFLTELTDAGSQPNAQLLGEIETLQETLLRGQFSTFPVSVRTPFWSSARNRGINARVKLQEILNLHFTSLSGNHRHCPILRNHNISDTADIANHVLLFTSGLANKALASFLTATIMNVFLHQRPKSSAQSTNLAQLLRSIPHNSTHRSHMLRSIMTETERLSPPVVGVLRRAVEDTELDISMSSSGNTKYTIPTKHEAWLYFPSASRSTAIFGPDAEIFRWDRFVPYFSDPDSSDLPMPASLAFGAGPKTCLGQRISRTMVELVVTAFLDSNVDMAAIPGNGLEPGVQAMLGWCTIEEAGGVEAVARDVKQLPTQRARRPVLVKVMRHLG